jgi:hypothetical protein
MTRRRLTLLALLAAGLAAVAGTLTGHCLRAAKPPPTKSANAGLRVDPKFLDFGEVWEQDRFEWNLPIQNQSSQPTIVTGLHGSCTCQSMNPLEFTIPAGGHQQIQVVLVLRSRASRAEPDRHEDFAVALWADVAGTPAATYWQLRGGSGGRCKPLTGSIWARSPTAPRRRQISGSTFSRLLAPCNCWRSSRLPP